VIGKKGQDQLNLAKRVDDYFARFRMALCNSDRRPLYAFVNRLWAAGIGEQEILFCGNGGSAGLASHYAMELAHIAGRVQFMAHSLSENVQHLTAMANDYGYRDVFYRQLHNFRRRPGDLLVCISSSGRSENVVEAAVDGQRLGYEVWALTGCSEAARKSDLVAAVKPEQLVQAGTTDTGIFEAIQLVWLHLVYEELTRRSAIYPQNPDTRRVSLFRDPKTEIGSAELPGDGDFPDFVIYDAVVFHQVQPGAYQQLMPDQTLGLKLSGRSGIHVVLASQFSAAGGKEAVPNAPALGTSE